MTSAPPPPPDRPRRADSSVAGHRVVPLVPRFGRRPATGRPLPDATAVRLLVVPDSAPPYDDSRAAAAEQAAEVGELGRGGLDGGPAGQSDQARPLEVTEPPIESSDRPEGPRQAEPPGQSPVPGQSPAPGSAAPPTAAEWPSQFAQILAETLAGSRSCGQIRPWTTDQACRRIRQLGPVLTAGIQPRVRRIVTSLPAAGVVEMTVIVGFGPRIRALAVRMEHAGSPLSGPGPSATTAKWVCTAIEAA